MALFGTYLWNDPRVTYGLKNYSQKDVWSEQVAEKSVYAV